MRLVRRDVDRLGGHPDRSGEQRLGHDATQVEHPLSRAGEPAAQRLDDVVLRAGLGDQVEVVGAEHRRPGRHPARHTDHAVLTQGDATDQAITLPHQQVRRPVRRHGLEPP